MTQKCTFCSGWWPCLCLCPPHCQTWTQAPFQYDVGKIVFGQLYLRTTYGISDLSYLRTLISDRIKDPLVELVLEPLFDEAIGYANHYRVLVFGQNRSVFEPSSEIGPCQG